MSSRALLSRSITAASIALALFGCGISQRYVVESDMRFEHCYRIDDDPRTPLDAKRACWHEWRTQFSRAQDHARTSYADDRARVLDAAAAGAAGGTAAAPRPVGESGLPTLDVAASACPPPTSPYAPPPSIGGGEVSAVNGAPAIQSCSDACARLWRACSPACNADVSCASDCETKYRACMKLCF